MTSYAWIFWLMAIVIGLLYVFGPVLHDWITRTRNVALDRGDACRFCKAWPASFVDHDMVDDERLPADLLYRRVCSPCRRKHSMPAPERRRTP